MTITSIGYDGTVNEQAWAKIARFLGRDASAAGSTDWQVSVVAGQDRTVQVAPGVVYGDGVLDTNDANITVQLPVVASGTRWDTIVVHRNWSPTPPPTLAGLTTVTSVQGTAVKGVAAGLAASPGVGSDRPLALVQVTAGVQLPTAVVDLRNIRVPHPRIVNDITDVAPADRVDGLLIRERTTGRARLWNGTLWLTLYDPNLFVPAPFSPRWRTNQGDVPLAARSFATRTLLPSGATRFEARLVAQTGWNTATAAAGGSTRWILADLPAPTQGPNLLRPMTFHSPGAAPGAGSRYYPQLWHLYWNTGNWFIAEPDSHTVQDAINAGDEIHFDITYDV